MCNSGVSEKIEFNMKGQNILSTNKSICEENLSYRSDFYRWVKCKFKDIRCLPKSVKLSIFVISIYVFIAIVYDLLPIVPYNEQTLDILMPPSSEHILGTDDLGMDILSQLLYGTRISIIIGLSCASISVLIGGILGVISAYFGGFIDKFILSVIDVFSALPNLPLMIVLSAFLGANILNVVFAISVLSWVGVARMTRSKVISIKNQQFLQLARSYGGKFPYILIRHLLPSLYPIFLTGFIRTLNRAIIAEASLAFLGLSDPTSKSWGMVLNSVLQFENIFLTDFWKWWLLSPIAFLLIFIFSVANIGKNFEARV